MTIVSAFANNIHQLTPLIYQHHHITSCGDDDLAMMINMDIQMMIFLNNIHDMSHYMSPLSYHNIVRIATNHEHYDGEHHDDQHLVIIIGVSISMISIFS